MYMTKQTQGFKGLKFYIDCSNSHLFNKYVVSSESNHRTILKYLILLLSRNLATCLFPSQPFFAFESHTILIETQIQLILSTTSTKTDYA